MPVLGNLGKVLGGAGRIAGRAFGPLMSAWMAYDLANLGLSAIRGYRYKKRLEGQFRRQFAASQKGRRRSAKGQIIVSPYSASPYFAARPYKGQL